MVTEDTSENSNESIRGRQAEELFPDLFQQSAKEKINGPTVPQPLGDSWLQSDSPAAREETKLHALLLLSDVRQQRLVEQKLQKMGYEVAVAPSATEAVEQFRTAQFQLVVCDTEASSNSFHLYISQSVPQQRRRLLYYVLIGPDVHTCYDLEALAFSTNLVINVRELPYLEVILRKGFRDYEKLFRPFLEVLGDDRSPVPL